MSAARAFVTSILIATVAPVAADIEKLAVPSERGMQFHWWPKLPPVEGWQHDREFSLKYSINALAPVGKSFANAETVMYAKAVFKPRVPDVKSLGQLIENDKKDKANVPGVVVAEAPSLLSADGRKLSSLTYTPNGTGNWERVSYLEEGEFYLIFTVSSRSLAGFKSSAKAYEALVALYREKP